MFKALALLTILISIVLPASMQVGGSIPIINRVDVVSISGIDFRLGGRDIPIARLRISNNLPDFSVSFKLDDPLAFSEQSGKFLIKELKLRETGGLRGSGLEDPTGTVLELDPVTGGFTWSPGTQHSATLNYEVEVLATWEKNSRENGQRQPQPQPQLLAGMSAVGL